MPPEGARRRRRTTPGSIYGSFDVATYTAVEKIQAERNLYVDGIVGRESAISLAIWPDEESFVVRTPKPAPGSKDLLGYPLSSVAVSGPDAPPMPPNSRLAGSDSSTTVPASACGRSTRTSASSARGSSPGSKYANELPGVHKVYSKSEVSTAWNGKAYLPLMVRWLDTEHRRDRLPRRSRLHVEDGSPYMTDAELGQRLSGGCQRQANVDAKFMWDFADIGTTVVVL